MAVGNGDLRTTCAHSLSVLPPAGPLKTISLSASRRTLRLALGFHSAVLEVAKLLHSKRCLNGTAATLLLHRLLTSEGVQATDEKACASYPLFISASPSSPMLT